MIDDLRIRAGRSKLIHSTYGKLRWYSSRKGLAQIKEMITSVGWSVQCPFCGWQGRQFYPHAEPHPRPNSLCPRCHSKERHRLLHLYLEQQGILSNRLVRVLEIGPEQCWPLLFSSKPHASYIGLDTESPLAMVHGDVTRLPFPDRIFDLVICYHVLEHVLDDRSAMREICRVLAPTGTLFVQVPIQGDVTDEDPAVVDPAERQRRFGQVDHVRQYGNDFTYRLAEAGFAVTVDDFAAKLPQDTVDRLGLVRDELIYVCRVNEQAQ